MENKKFEIFIKDVGDESVGIRPVVTAKMELDEYFVEYLKNDGHLKDFEKAFENLVNEFLEPETKYETFDTDDIKAEE